MTRWKPYVPVMQRRAQARRAAAKLLGSGATLSPVQCAGRSMAATFWGKAWCANLESYSDFANRLPRGRTYARNGSVLNLRVKTGEKKQATIEALVSGSELYRVTVRTKPLPQARWATIQRDCTGQIDSVVELLGGQLSDGVMAVVTRQGNGLFPTPDELDMHCTCPDWATMCKHVAAVLYGVGARLDEDPGMLFSLRGVNPEDLVAEAMAELTPKRGRGRVLAAESVAAIFGLNMDDDEDELDDGVQRDDGAPFDDGVQGSDEFSAPGPVTSAAPKPPSPGLLPPTRRLPKKARMAALVSLNPTERRVLSLVFNEPGVSAATVAERLGVAEAETAGAAARLVQIGLLGTA